MIVKLRCVSWRQLQAIYDRDLTRGGFFLKSKQPPPVGTPIRIELTLPSESTVTLDGTIREHIAAGGLEGRGPGIDLALTQVPQSVMWMIESALDAARANEANPTRKMSPLTSVQDEVTRPGVERALEEGEAVVQAADDLIAALADEYESMRKRNPFQQLGVGYDTTDDEVRNAFGELTRRYHPDRFRRFQSHHAHVYASELFILIRDAYQQLKDAAGRARILARLERGSQAVPLPAPALPNVASREVKSAGLARAATVLADSPPKPPRKPTPPPVSPAAPALFDEESPPTSNSGSKAVRLDALRPAPRSNTEAEKLLERGDYNAALRIFKVALSRNPADKQAQAGVELAEGLRALAEGDRMEAAQRFELVLELEPSNERAARELAEMRRRATNERKGLLAKLMGQPTKK